ncbi:uncharacterized protein LOC118427320 [Branchiostoma floridae]|uniref:Uncharacterized protein LOC118427320 n=1 Tax=Branchiostoma floridae TaxID=7739 RepID=C3YK44_BRAFL|nr:uncharacterized protein LOC118427320 [Branchiostoma floridae]|eukprot:XP_002603490.1 hypothetical protein BRAFLDRAFT_79029 [Branchiostoma floridae]
MAYLLQVCCKKIYLTAGGHHTDPTQFSDFEARKEKVQVSNPAKFFRDHGRDYLVCCADFEDKALVLAKPKDLSEVKAAPFVRETLRSTAEELLVIPFSELADVATEVAKDVEHVTTVFLHHTMRCGSTLLVKALQASGEMHTISEPDVHTNFAHYALQKDPSSDDEEMLKTVIRHTNTLFNYTLLQDNPSKTITCYKLRGQVLPIADLLQTALPRVKNIFLYRDVIGYVDSSIHLMAGGRYWKYWLQTTLKRDVKYVQNVGDIVVPSPWDVPVFTSIPVTHGVVWFFACIWLILMKKANELTKDDPHKCFHVILRYDELCRYKEDMVLKVMDILGIGCRDKDAKHKIRELFSVDSQAGHRLSSRGPGGGGSWVGDWEMGIILKVLEHANMEINQPDFVTNGTLTHI